MMKQVNNNKWLRHTPVQIILTKNELSMEENISNFLAVREREKEISANRDLMRHFLPIFSSEYRVKNICHIINIADINQSKINSLYDNIEASFYRQYEFGVGL